MKKQPTYVRAHAAMMDYLLSFATSTVVEGDDSDYPRLMGGLTGFVNEGILSGKKAVAGDLVLMQSAPASKWRLSWLVERVGGDLYLCASVIDRELCNWSNVRVAYLHRPTLKQHPEWRWDDDQFAFDDRWMKACKRHDPYIYRPLSADFGDDGVATIGVRCRFSRDAAYTTVQVPNWRKITQRDMAGIYLALVAEHKATEQTQQAPQ